MSNLLNDIIANTDFTQKTINKFLTSNGENLKKLALEYNKETDWQRYLSRLSMAISKDNNLADCFNTPEGRLSISIVMRECIETGCLPGKDCYIIPYKKKNKDEDGNWKEYREAQFQPRAEAYTRICLSEPNPIFSAIDYKLVYEHDSIDIDLGMGTISHKINPLKPRGNIVGCWIKLSPVRIDKNAITDFWTIERIYKTRDTYSMTWKQYIENQILFQKCANGEIAGAVKKSNGGYEYKNGKYDKYVPPPEKNTTPWHTDEESMIVKTIIKGVLKPWTRLKPTLESLYHKDEVIEESSEIVADLLSDKAPEQPTISQKEHSVGILDSQIIKNTIPVNQEIQQVQ